MIAKGEKLWYYVQKEAYETREHMTNQTKQEEVTCRNTM